MARRWPSLVHDRWGAASLRTVAAGPPPVTPALRLPSRSSSWGAERLGRAPRVGPGGPGDIGVGQQSDLALTVGAGQGEDSRCAPEGIRTPDLLIRSPNASAHMSGIAGSSMSHKRRIGHVWKQCVAVRGSVGGSAITNRPMRTLSGCPRVAGVGGRAWSWPCLVRGGAGEAWTVPAASSAAAVPEQQARQSDQAAAISNCPGARREPLRLISRVAEGSCGGSWAARRPGRSAHRRRGPRRPPPPRRAWAGVAHADDGAGRPARGRDRCPGAAARGGHRGGSGIVERPPHRGAAGEADSGGAGAAVTRRPPGARARPRR